MITVAIKELKNKLSAYLRDVAQGEIVLVTDRGRVVAELRQPSYTGIAGPEESALERLAKEGFLERGLPQNKSAYRPSPLLVAVNTQSLLDDERGPL